MHASSWPPKKKQAGRQGMLYNIHPCQKSDSKLGKWTGSFADLENVFTCRWLELNSPMDDAAFVGGRLLVFPLAWVTHRSPKISLIQKLSQAWDYLRALMLSKLQIGDEHCVIGQVNRVIEHRSSTVSLLFLGCHTLNLWEQHLHWKVNLVGKICIAKYTNKYSLINFTKWTYPFNWPSEQETKHF